VTASDTDGFCVVCGRANVALEGGVCADCEAKRIVLVGTVQRPTVVLCPMCGARRVGERWERRGSSPELEPEDWMPLLAPHPEVGIRSAVATEEPGSHPQLRRFSVRLGVRFRGTEREAEVPLAVRVESRACPDCSRKSGRYYTALVQLRGPSERVGAGARERRARVRARFDRAMAQAAPPGWEEKVAWEEERPEGWDFYLVDTPTARDVARVARQRLGARLTESASLHGRRNGRDVYRVTFCVRVPDVPSAPSDAPLPASRRAARPVERYS
jgi:nonsense-mediated mRNA decay protein 3